MITEIVDLHRKHELSSMITYWLHFDVAAKSLADLFANRQTEFIASGIKLESSSIWWLVKGLENVLNILLVHANSSIFDFYT